MMSDIAETLLRESDRLISIVGGGGKTSLMFYLAHVMQQKGLRVVSTTTTRILRPTSKQSRAVVLLDDPGFKQNLHDSLDQHGHVTVAQHLSTDGKKLQGLSCSQVKILFECSFVDKMIVEADGARQLSFKAPGDNEPVVPLITDVFIGVVGLDIIGKPLEDANVFRPELVSSLTGLPMGAEITPLTVAKLFLHSKGLSKGCPEKARSVLFLNKTDISGGSEKALSVMKEIAKLEGRKPDHWVSGSTREGVLKKHR